MLELVIASNNQGKIKELRALLPDFRLHSLQAVGLTAEIPEPYETFEENALNKARTVYEFCGMNTLSDDSGICVPALGNAPGVHSAYYGGLPRSDEKNNARLLKALSESQGGREAFYKAVICLIWHGEPYFFEGICEGRIAEAPVGTGGFGYDPLFIPSGYEHTFAELPAEVKNGLSHRGKAIQKMVAFLKEHTGT